MKNKILWGLCVLLFLIWLLLPKKEQPYYSPYPLWQPTMVPNIIVITPTTIYEPTPLVNYQEVAENE